MRVGRNVRLASVLVIGGLIFAAAQEANSDHGPTVEKRATLPAIDVSSLQPLISNDRHVKLGGIGSGLFPISKNEYWTVTDRGPNADAGELKTFILPEFTPQLVRIRVEGKTLDVRQHIPITSPSGVPVTGLPNFPKKDDPKPVLSDGVTETNYDPNGIDSEGIIRTHNGHFWVAEEYGPSVLELDAKGHVLRRLVPAGTKKDYSNVAQMDGSAVSVGYPVIGSLPAVLSKRRANRGFEDIALLPDGHTVVVALQSPTDKASRVTKLITLDTADTEHLSTVDYEFDAPSTFDGGDAKAKDLKISALIPIDQRHVVVEERTDAEARFYTVNLHQVDHVIKGHDKTLLTNLAGVAGVPGKIEGAAMKDPDTLVVISDNDFGFANHTYQLSDKVKTSDVPTVLDEIALPTRKPTSLIGRAVSILRFGQ